MVLRIDPETKEVVKRFRTDGVPNDIAVGGGALWIGNGGGEAGGNFTNSVARVDFLTGRTTDTITLPDDGGTGDFGFLDWGYPQLAVGAGALWAINPDRTVSRIDLDSGRLVAKVDVDAATIAAGDEGVWFISRSEKPTITRIDPRTNRAGQSIRLGAYALSAIAVGAGSVWATAEGEGLLWRIEPGRNPITRTIDVGVGATYVAAGAGAIWTANYVDGTVARIDVEHNTAESTSRGRGAGARRRGRARHGSAPPAGPRTGCRPRPAGRSDLAGTADPDVLIASNLPLQGPEGAGARAMQDAIRVVLSGAASGREVHSRLPLLRRLDRADRDFDKRACAANANSFARTEDSGRDRPLQLGVRPDPDPDPQPGAGRSARADQPVEHLSGAHSSRHARPVGLPRRARGALPDGQAQLPPHSGRGRQHGAAHALLARRLGLRSVYVIHDGTGFWKGLRTDPFRRAAGELGLRVAGRPSTTPAPGATPRWLSGVARSGADGVVLGGDPYVGGDRC